MSKGLLGLNGMVGCFGMVRLPSSPPSRLSVQLLTVPHPQTELAHGSNVAGLETTATFDERTDEFVIHTPSVSATKWWIGGAFGVLRSAEFGRGTPC